MPVAYSAQSVEAWEPFARLALEAGYEATLLAALGAEGPVYLTLLGGGAFGNRSEWVLEALERALEMFGAYDLDVRIVSYDRARCELKPLLARFE